MRLEPTLAEEFGLNSYFEGLLKLRRTKPETFEVLTDNEKFALELYEQEKEKHLAKKGEQKQ